MKPSNTGNDAILKIDDLMIQRGNLQLCYPINHVVFGKQIIHVKGKNGVGKSTFLMQLAGILPIVQGKLQWLKNIDAATLVYVSHQSGFYEQLTVSQNIIFMLRLYGICPSNQQIEDMLDWIGLKGYETELCSRLSAGQLKKVNLARLKVMSVQNAPIWLLDEPYSNIDIDMIDKLDKQIVAFAGSGGAVVVTSHQPVSIANTMIDLHNYVAHKSSMESFDESTA